MSDGHGLLALWRAVEKQDRDFCQNFGVVLDVQQLFTQNARSFNGRERFLSSLALIPNDALRAFQSIVDTGCLLLQDPIPWEAVFERIGRLDHDFLITPEVHHGKTASAAIQFCSRLLPGHQV